jgi:hypothetical protein
VCQSVYPTIVAGLRLRKNVPAATKNCWRRRFIEVCFVLKESRRVILPITSCVHVTQQNGSGMKSTGI